MPLAAILVWLAAALTLGALTLTDRGRMMLATVAADIMGSVLWITARIAPTIAVQFAKGLVTAFEKDRETWGQVVAVFTAEIGNIVGGGGAGAGAASAPGVPGAANIAAPLAQAVMAAIAPAGPLTPESGEAHLQTLLGLMFALGLQGWWVEAVGDIVSLGHFGAAADLPDAVERSMGLSRIGRLAWRTPIKKAIAEPLEELYNTRYRFKKLTLGEGHQAWHRGLISDAEFLAIAGAAGYSPDRAALLLKLAQTPYPLDMIRDLDRVVGLAEPVLLDLLAEHGFTGGRGTTALTLLREREVDQALRELATQARKLYGAGRITQAQLTAMLREARMGDREIGIVLATEDLVRADARTLTVGEIKEAVRDGALDPPQARARLRALGYRDEDVDVLLALRGKQPTSGQIIDAVARGRITPQQGHDRLMREGYSDADAALLISLRGRRLSEGQVLDALRQQLINAQTARTDLVELGFPPDQADLLLAFQRKELSPADVQAAVLRGLLTAEEALAHLTRAGYSREDATVIITLRRRLLLPGEILDAFEDGFITRVEALGDLQARGLTPEDALAVVRVFEQRIADRRAVAQRREAAAAARPARPGTPSFRRRGTGAPPP